MVVDEESDLPLNNLGKGEGKDGWARFTYDTGAALSVFPKSYLSERVIKTLQGNGRAYRSACRRSVPDEGKISVYGWTSENDLG